MRGMTKQSWELQMCSRLAAKVVLATGNDEGSPEVAGILRIPIGSQSSVRVLELPGTSAGTA